MKISGREIRFSDLREKIRRQRERKLGWFNRLMLWLNYFAAVALLASYASRFISPEAFWPLAFFGLAYPLILIANIVFIIYWLAQLRILAVISVIVIVVGARSLFSYVQFQLTEEKPLKSDVKVMSYNCMLFDLYNWSHNKASRKKIFTMLEKESPDIVCFQEFFTSENPVSFNNRDTLTKFLPATNLHVEYTTTLRNVDHWGVATLSKYPIVKKGKLAFDVKTNNICIFTDVVIDKDTVRIYNMHLQSIQFKKEDYDYVSEVIEKYKAPDEVEKGKTILRRLKAGFIKRAAQAQVIADHMKGSPYEIIVCGDFNDTPSSFAYNTIRGNMSDAFIERGSGFEKTYNGRMPAFRIDYILHSKEIETIQYSKVKETITDHYPVTAYLRIND